MLHRAWYSKGEMSFCFPRSSIKFQGHMGQNIGDFDPNWAFPDYGPVAAFKSLRFALYIALSVMTSSGITITGFTGQIQPSWRRAIWLHRVGHIPVTTFIGWGPCINNRWLSLIHSLQITNTIKKNLRVTHVCANYWQACMNIYIGIYLLDHKNKSHGNLFIMIYFYARSSRQHVQCFLKVWHLTMVTNERLKLLIILYWSVLNVTL